MRKTLIRIGAPALCALAPVLCPVAWAEEPIAASADAEAAYKAQIKAFSDRANAQPYGDYAAKAPLLQQRANLVKAHSGETSEDYSNALALLAYEAYVSGEFAAEVPFRRQILTIARALEAQADTYNKSSAHDDTLYAAHNLAIALDKSGHPDDAIAVLQPVVDDPANDRSKMFAAPYAPEEHFFGASYYLNPPLNRLENLYASLVLKHGSEPAKSLFAARQAMLSVRLYRQNLGSSRFEEWELADVEKKGWADNFAGEERFGDFYRLYADAAWSANQRSDATREDVFKALQDITLDRTTRALAEAAGARATRKHNAGALLDRRHALTVQTEALFKQLVDNSGSMSQPEKDAIDVLINQLDAERDALDIKLNAAAPEYFALVRPRTLTVAEVQALLKPGEAALMITPAQFGTHVMLIDQQGIVWHRSGLTEEALNGHVRRLLWDVGANIDVTPEENAKWSAEGTGLYPFDRKTAHLLYRELVEPFAARLHGTKFLYVVAGGSLSSLPFSLLVTAPPEGDDGDPATLRATPWLGDSIALLQLPSLQSLQLLRSEKANATGKLADRLVGFGDPALDGEALERGGAGRSRGTRSGASMASAGFNSYGDGPQLADPASLRTLARLPGTARELQALQAVFGAGHSRIALAEAAREGSFKHADLTHLSVLALSTHGLLAGEAGVTSEPGLVFTPPAKASVDDDGFLTSSEIAALDIDADWVILSACNTAAGDGSSGATGLSGLVRAFFFAGARSVLASHWPVKDAVAEKMIPLIVELQRQHPEWTRAQALQAAEKTIRDDTTGDEDLASWAHPSAWAPFTLIGDAGY